MLALFEQHAVEHVRKLDDKPIYARKVGVEAARMLQGEAPDMVLGHLENRQTTVAEAAYLLGFSEPGVFQRIVKRWTGSTPGDFRLGLGF